MQILPYPVKTQKRNNENIFTKNSDISLMFLVVWMAVTWNLLRQKERKGHIEIIKGTILSTLWLSSRIIWHF